MCVCLFMCVYECVCARTHTQAYTCARACMWIQELYEMGNSLRWLLICYKSFDIVLKMACDYDHALFDNEK